MKKILLGISAIGLSLVLTACGSSANDAAINGLSKQLDDTSNTLADFSTVNPSDLSMSKSALDSIATKDTAIYDNVIGTQQSLLNEEYYKADILSRTAKLKNCISKDLSLSKAQISAVKDLTNNLAKYTNSVSYTKNELDSAVKSVASMKKNTEKNADKISAKLSRIACNSNTRMAYYENIINTLNQLENYVCCENCETPDENTDNSQESETQSTESTNTTNNEDSTNTDQNKQPAQRGLPINIDTYAPTNRNIDTIAYNNMYNQYGNYARGYGYGAGYGVNGYGATPYGINGNGYSAYGYGMRGYPAYGYNMAYNSNNINRANGAAVPVAEMQATSNVKNSKIKNEAKVADERIEDFEEIKDGELQKVESKNQPIELSKNNENSVSTNTQTIENKTKNLTDETSEKISDVAERTTDKIKDFSKKASDKAEEEAKKLPENVLKVSARNFEPIKDNRSKEEIEKDLNQPIIAHKRPIRR